MAKVEYEQKGQWSVPKPRVTRTREIKIVLTDDELKSFNSVAAWMQTTRAGMIRQVVLQRFNQLRPAGKDANNNTRDNLSG